MSEDYGKHLMGVEDLLQKHSLLEADIHVVGERVKTVNNSATRFIDDDFQEVGGEIEICDAYCLSSSPMYIVTLATVPRQCLCDMARIF